MPISVVYDSTCMSLTGACCLWTVPDGVTSVTFQIWGGGGGAGGGLTMCDCCARTQGGGGGGYSMRTVAVQPGQQYTLCAGNAGVASSSFGAPVGYCCNGCPGGTSFVTGPGITSTFCATGGSGGCSNFTINCYGHCGCNGAHGGFGFGGDDNERGMPGVKGMSGSGSISSYSLGGQAGGPGGGVGGVNNGGQCGGGNWVSDACAAPSMHGTVPGGGGAGHGCGTQCICYDGGAGRGAPGMVRIHW